MTQKSTEISDTLNGVFDVLQDRSRRSRDDFINSGMLLLNSKRFVDLTISELAGHCGLSVGAFYRRFKDKETYFSALQSTAVARNKLIIDDRLATTRLDALSPEAVMDELVDVLSDIFAGEGRGVQRESLLRILEPVDGWAPMRASGQIILKRLIDRLSTAYPGLSSQEAERKVRFCYQVIVGVLQNDLVNDFHMFSTRDRSIRAALKAIIRDHMSGPSSY